MGGAIPSLVALGSVRKQAEQAVRGASQQTSLFHGLCISSGLQVLFLFDSCPDFFW